MLNYINGTITKILEASIVIDIGGLGINVIVNNPQGFKLNNRYILSTYLAIGEKDFKIIGFKTQAELDLFIKLLKIKGIGYKTILEIERYISPTEFINLIKENNPKPLLKIKGIGNKTIDSIFKEFKQIKANPLEKELLLSLKSLGYTSEEIREAIARTIYPVNITINDAIKLTLKSLS